MSVPPSPHQPAAMVVPAFFVSHRITLMINRHEIRAANPDGGEGPLRLDFRVAASMAVALDALQSR